MIIQFIIGCILIGITVIVHACALYILLRFTEHPHFHLKGKLYKFHKMMLIIISVLGVFLATVIEIWLWAITLYFLDISDLPTFESALYFSTSTFTTVGYGDLVLSEDWRLLGSFESANGLLLFGWSTAFIFEITARLYKTETL